MYFNILGLDFEPQFFILVDLFFQHLMELLILILENFDSTLEWGNLAYITCFTVSSMVPALSFLDWRSMYFFFQRYTS